MQLLTVCVVLAAICYSYAGTLEQRKVPPMAMTSEVSDSHTHARHPRAGLLDGANPLIDVGANLMNNQKKQTDVRTQSTGSQRVVMTNGASQRRANRPQARRGHGHGHGRGHASGGRGRGDRN